MGTRLARTKTLPLVEFQQVTLPAHLDGHDGLLRGKGVQTIGAQNDVEAIALWLKRQKSPHTLKAYKKEAERLLLWIHDVHGKPLSSMMEEDFLAYQRFTANPQPAWRWIGKRGASRGDIYEWKPFAKPLTVKSQAQAMQVLKLMLSYLHKTGYLAANALATYRIERPEEEGATVERYLSQETVQAMFEAVERMPKRNDEECAEYERARFLLRLLYVCGPRAAEVIGARMGDIYQRDGRWWWKIKGKGRRPRTVPFTPNLVASLQRYRRFRRLPALPSTAETAPLIPSLRGGGMLSETDALRRVIREIGKRVAEALPAGDLRGVSVVKATTHWMRHTGGTHMTRSGLALPQVQAILGHKSIATTGTYQHNEAEQLHDEVANRFADFIPV